MRIALVPIASLLIALAASPAPPVHADLMIVGIDEKVTFDAEGDRAFVAPGKDSIVVVDIANREAPRIVATFPLMITDTGKKLTLPGQPASMRGRHP